MKQKHEIFSGLGERACDRHEDKSDQKSNYEKFQIPTDIKIFPIGKNFNSVSLQAKFKDKFDVMFMSHRAYPSGDEAQKVLNPMMKRGAHIVVETGKYIFPMKKEGKAALIEKWKELGEKVGWRTVSRHSPLKNDLLEFQK